MGVYIGTGALQALFTVSRPWKQRIIISLEVFSFALRVRGAL